MNDISLQKLKLTILYDNQPYRSGLQTSWGFSCLVDTGDQKILFDTGGDNEVLSANMELLGVDPVSIDVVTLSHFHWDHIGGLYSTARRVRPEVPIYVIPTFSQPFIADLKRLHSNIHIISEPFEISDVALLTGPVGDPGGDVPVEQALAVRTEKGIALVTGCAHPGVASLVDVAKNLTGQSPLLVLGGFHLLHESDQSITAVAEDLMK